MFPNNNNVNKVKSIIEETNKDEELNSFQGDTYLYDYEKGDFVIEDGKLVRVSGVEAVLSWVEKIIRTSMNKFKIYEDNDKTSMRREYGNRIKELYYGKKVPELLLESEIRREIEESLEKHRNIINIENYKSEVKETLLKISFNLIIEDNNKNRQKVEVNFSNWKIET